MKALDARLAALEAARALALERDPVKDWLALYRAGADVHSRNAVAGAAEREAAAERERLALETLEAYDETFNYQPSGTA